MQGAKLQLVASPTYHSLADTWFLELVADRGLRHVAGATWATDASEAALLDRAVAHVSYAEDGADELVVDLGDAVAHVILTAGMAKVRAAASCRAVARAATERIAQDLPPRPTEPRALEARLWWWDGIEGSEILATVPAPAWDEVRGNYAAATADSLAPLMTAHAGPPAGGRLVVFHGPSGTGKTHAVQTLAGAWRGWADLHVVSDPEELLANPSYLMTVANPRGDARPGRWRLIVLEDVGEHLAVAATASRPVLGRLLNVIDGVLGIALRVIVVVTTNERPDRLDARLRRPGRLLAEIGFAPLARDELVRWCAARSLTPPDCATATVAELYALAAGRVVRPAQPRVGFASAAH